MLLWSPSADPFALRDGNTGCLTLAPIFELDFGQPEHDAGNHPSHCAAQIDLLGYGYHANTALAPIGQQINAIALEAREAVELPHYHGPNGALKDAAFKLTKGESVGGVATFLVFEPSYDQPIDIVVFEPALDLDSLAIVFLMT